MLFVCILFILYIIMSLETTLFVNDFDTKSTAQRMAFINNALELGWRVKKRSNKYIFSRKHHGKNDVYLDTYIQTFLKSCSDTLE